MEHVCDMVICPVHFESVVNNFHKSKVFSHKTHIKIAKLLKVLTFFFAFIKMPVAIGGSWFPGNGRDVEAQNTGRIYFP